MHHSQFQESKVRIAVVCLLFTLLCNVLLKYCGCFWVVSIKAVQDRIDLLRPIRRVIERDSHRGGMRSPKSSEELELQISLVLIFLKIDEF